MSKDKFDLIQLLENSGAILHGHFKLTSGRHSDVYFEKFRVLEHPEVLSRLCAEIVAHYSEKEIDFVAGPTTGGIIIAFEVGRQMNLPTRYVETEAGKKTFRRNADIPKGSKFLLVDDVLTTGLSLMESASAIRSFGGEVIGLGVLIDRSEHFEPGLPLFSSCKVEASSYDESEVPGWLQKIPVTKPGTRS